MKKVIILLFLFFNISFANEPFSISLKNKHDRVCGEFNNYILNIKLKKNISKNFEIIIRFSHPYYSQRSNDYFYQTKFKNKPGYTTISTKFISLNIIKKNISYYSHPSISLKFLKNLKKDFNFQIIIGDTKFGSNGIKTQIFSQNNAEFLTFYKINNYYKKILKTPKFKVIPSKLYNCFIFIPSFIKPHKKFKLNYLFTDKYFNYIRPKFKIISIYAENIENPNIKFNLLNNTSKFLLPITGNFWIKAKIKTNNKFFNIISNPFICSNSNENLYFGDFHGHCSYSDGINKPSEYFKNAMKYCLNFSSLTDHNWMLSNKEWLDIIKQTNKFNKKNEFVCFPGMEFNLSGHRNFYYFDKTPILSKYHKEINSWMRELNNIQPIYFNENKEIFFDPYFSYIKYIFNIPKSFAVYHTTASIKMGSKPYFLNSYIEPVIEIYSSHGSSLYKGSPNQIYPFKEKHFVLNFLNRNYKPGFVACNDSHDGRPAKTTFGNFNGGLTAIFSKELSKNSLYSSFIDKKTYVTTGNRPIIIFKLNNKNIGSTIHSDNLNGTIVCLSTQKINYVKIFLNKEIYKTISINKNDFNYNFNLKSPEKSSYIFLEFGFKGNYFAWTTPFYITPENLSEINNINIIPLNNKLNLNFNFSKGLSHSKFLLYKRIGNKGNAKLNLYKKININFNRKKNNELSFIDNNIIKNISYFYILAEKLKNNKIMFYAPIHGLIPYSVPCETNFKLQKIKYCVPENGTVKIIFKDKFEKIIYSMEKNNVKSGFYEFYPYKLLKSKLTSYVIFNNRKYYTCKYNVIVNNISSPTKKIIVNIE